MMEKKHHDKKIMYHPWFPAGEAEEHFLSYIHQSLHHQIGEDVGFPDSSWSYTTEESAFEKKDHSDTTLHYRVMDEFYKVKDIDASGIKILVHNGIVNLSGTVRTKQEQTRAEKMVRAMDGVWNVENELTIDDGSTKQRGFDLPLPL